MNPSSHNDTVVRSPLVIRGAVLAAIGFYVGTAHLTRGHEADWGKQWLAARLVASGQGRSLFDQAVQRAELEKHYGAAVIERGIWREGIGGPTYPPTLAVVFAPLGWLSPQRAQWVVVELSIIAVLLAAWQVSKMGTRLPWETAALATLCMPSFFFAVGVGQNSAICLAILAVGWSLIARERTLLAGVAWGLFVIKPTWGIAVAWVPLVLGRPRAYLGMAVSSGVLVALTLPVCGFEGWLDWLAVARQTESYYETLPRWTELSRDLPGLFRRVGHGTVVELAGLSAVAAIVAVTAWTWRRVRSDGDGFGGRGSVVLLAGSMLSCPRFMFYDVTLAVLPFLVAFARWPQMSRPARAALASCAALVWPGTVVCYAQWQMAGLPLDTLGLVGLWFVSVAEALVARRRSGAAALPDERCVPSGAAVLAKSA